MNQSRLERERVNERLECRAGRSRAARAVHLAVDVDPVEISRSNLRQHIHRTRIDQKGGRVFDSAIPAPCHIIRDSSFDCLLSCQIKGGDALVAAARTPQDLLNKMRRDTFSIPLRPRAEIASGKIMPVAPGAIVPIRLRLIDRTVVAFGKERPTAWRLWNYAKRDGFRSAQL